VTIASSLAEFINTALFPWVFPLFLATALPRTEREEARHIAASPLLLEFPIHALADVVVVCLFSEGGSSGENNCEHCGNIGRTNSRLQTLEPENGIGVRRHQQQKPLKTPASLRFRNTPGAWMHPHAHLSNRPYHSMPISRYRVDLSCPHYLESTIMLCCIPLAWKGMVDGHVSGTPLHLSE
jgi:hypothetical protein